MKAGSLVIMTRRPSPGATKTRLIPALGAEGAAALAAAFLEDLLRRFEAFPLGDRVLAWADGVGGGEAAPRGFRQAIQEGDDLGARMLAIYRQLEPPVVFLGSDAPTLPAAAVHATLEALGAGAVAVFQPALDGGFTLAAFGEDPGPLLAEVPWGTDRVLDTVLVRSAALPSRVDLIDPWYDVDVPQDLERLRAHLRSLRDRDGYAPRTAAVLERILESKT